MHTLGLCTSQLKGAEFVQLLTTEMLEEPTVSYEGLCDRLHQLNPEVNLTPQALAQRLTSAGQKSIRVASEFLRQREPR